MDVGVPKPPEAKKEAKSKKKDLKDVKESFAFLFFQVLGSEWCYSCNPVHSMKKQTIST